MLYRLLFVVFALTTISIQAQNLVPNHSFEQYLICPSGINQFQGYATDWLNPHPVGSNTGTPDYFHICNNSVPSNSRGWQMAQDGDAYCGIVVGRSNSNLDFREYIQVMLNSPLVDEGCYYFQMYISLAEVSEFNTDAIGVYFSPTLISNNMSPLPFVPQLVNTTGNFPDSLNWISVSGTYIADGGEQYMVIGNFFDHLNTTIVSVNPAASSNVAFVFVDNILLTTCTGIGEMASQAPLVYPNPFNDHVVVDLTTEESAEMIIYDVSSRIVRLEEFSGRHRFELSQLSTGIYSYEIRRNGKPPVIGKLVKY